MTNTNPVVEKILDDIHSKKNPSGTFKLEGQEEPRLRAVPVQPVSETKPKPGSIVNKPRVEHHAEHHIERYHTEHHKAKPGHRFEEAAKQARNEKLAAEKASKRSFLDETFTFKLNPRLLVKGVVLILIFISVFYIGRLTVGISSDDSGATAAVAAEESLGTIETVAEEPEKEPEFITGISGFFTKIIPDFSGDSAAADSELSAPEESEAETVATIAPETSTGSNDSTSATPTAAAVAEPVEEPIITTYSRVSLSIEGVTIDWKETWGKMTKVSYKIVNKEAGTVKPSYFIMIVEGYDDYNKRIDLPKNSQSIGSMKSVGSVATIENGFSYSEIQTGDLTSVQITLQLYDSNDVLITATNKLMDLSD